MSKPGYLTTEFWLSILIIVCGTVLVALSKIDASEWATIIAAVGIGYPTSRGLSKIGPTIIAPVPTSAIAGVQPGV